MDGLGMNLQYIISHMNGFDLPVSGSGPVLDTPASGKTAHAAASSAPLLGRRSPRQTPWGEVQGVGGFHQQGNLHLDGWLVVELTYPSEKYELVNWDDELPNIWEKQKMFQTTNQLWMVYFNVVDGRDDESIGMTYPSEKYELVNWDDEIPNRMER